MRSWIFRHRQRLRAIYGPRPQLDQKSGSRTAASARHDRRLAARRMRAARLLVRDPAAGGVTKGFSGKPAPLSVVGPNPCGSPTSLPSSRSRRPRWLENRARASRLQEFLARLRANRDNVQNELKAGVDALIRSMDQEALARNLEALEQARGTARRARPRVRSAARRADRSGRAGHGCTAAGARST
jgi:hypothetical protein